MSLLSVMKHLQIDHGGQPLIGRVKYTTDHPAANLLYALRYIGSKQY